MSPDGLVSVSQRDVIEVRFRRGSGDSAADPVRIVTGYFSLAGTRLAEHDPHYSAEAEKLVAWRGDLTP